jgi:hypothetical protein
MKAGISGLDCCLFFLVALGLVRSRSSLIPLVVPELPPRRAMSTKGEDGALVSEGVFIRDVVLELDLECVCVWRGLPPNDRLVEALVIARRAYSIKTRGEVGRRSPG